MKPFIDESQIIFYTRMGVGVFDSRWWDFRLRLFSAVTLPSVAAHVKRGAEWILFIDSMMIPSVRAALERALDEEGVKDLVRIAPVDFYVDIPRKLSSIASEYSNVRMVRIDDDDAVSDDFFELEDSTRPGIYTMPRGYEVSLADRRMMPIHKPFLSLNTIFRGPHELVETYAWVGHHRLPEWAAKNGLAIVESTAGSRSFLYVRHKQSDSSYGGRRSTILNSKLSISLTAQARDRFGINDRKLDSWRSFAQVAPGSPSSKTWEINAHLNDEALKIQNRLQNIKKEIIERTTNIFD